MLVGLLHMESYLCFFRKQQHLDINDIDAELCLNYLRELRNKCAENGSIAQTDIIANPKLLEYCFDIFDKLHNYNCSDIQIKCLRVGIQFIGNLLVDNPLNKAIIFVNYYPTIRKWIFNKDKVVANYTEMVLYNLLIDIEDVRDAICNDEHLLEKIVVDAEEEMEFGMLLLEKLTGHSFPLLYNKLSDKYRINLLKFFRKCLLEESITISVGCIEYIKELFKQAFEQLLDQTQCNSIEQTDNITDRVHIEILNTISRITYTSNYKSVLDSDMDFVSFILDKLLIIQQRGCDRTNIFSRHSDFHEIGTSQLPYHPVYGVKTILVQIVGNLCYRNKFFW
ncbi:hypothetical protein O3M35_004351 [Rhynocoris fuscipes]|uniref:Uncharacterized protein n=1 Tax=Rhynocoris fuscipes TaxID=488301 RepID=A0AAW1CN37_9HEMI